MQGITLKQEIEELRRERQGSILPPFFLQEHLSNPSIPCKLKGIFFLFSSGHGTMLQFKLPITFVSLWEPSYTVCFMDPKNPGRRFLCCPDYDPRTKTSACGAFRWVDEMMTEWQKNIINELIVGKQQLLTEVRKKGKQVQTLEAENNTVKVEKERLKNKCNSLALEVKKLKKTTKEQKGLVSWIVVAIIFLLLGRLM